MSFDGDCSAGRLYRCAWRECSRRPHTHATCERRIDAKASSDEVVVDVKVDRCMDENSVSNYGWVARLSPSFTEAPSIKIRDSSQTSLPRTKHHLHSQNVTITWYRLSRLTVYSSHTLSTFLTPLNQELWSIVLCIVNIFDIIKSRTMVYRSMHCWHFCHH